MAKTAVNSPEEGPRSPRSRKTASSKRRFGRVRVLPSGRYQARYLAPDGVDRPAPFTFATKTEADRWLVLKEAEIQRGEWINPDGGAVSFETYALQWIDDRVIKKTTEGLYRSLLKNHLIPTFGKQQLSDIKEADVRRWRKERLSATGQSTVAKAYQLLKSIMNTAVSDELIRRNPCRIKGASVPDTPERPVVPLSKVLEIAEAVPERYRALILLATFTSLRWGELAGLRRTNLDLDARTVRVAGSLLELNGGTLVHDAPKTRSSRRTVAIPPEIIPDLRRHVERFAQPGEWGHVFVGPKGGLLRRSAFRRVWRKVQKEVGLPDLHFHDLRHAGNTLAAATGASLRELMARMGHSSTRAALIYQHATQDRDAAIAQALGKALKSVQKERSGTQRARKIRKTT